MDPCGSGSTTLCISTDKSPIYLYCKIFSSFKIQKKNVNNINILRTVIPILYYTFFRGRESWLRVSLENGEVAKYSRKERDWWLMNF